MKYFLFDHASSANRGCEAIVRGTMNIISHADKQAEFKLVSYSPKNDEHLGIALGAMDTRELTKFEKAISALNIKLGRSEEYALRKIYSPVSQQADDFEICLSIGGDTYCYGNNAHTRAITSNLHKKGKKVVLWGASIGKEDLSAEKIETLKKFDAIFVRESYTYSLLEKIVSPNKLFFFADPAFAMEREDLPLPDGFEQGNTMGFNLSALTVKKNPDLIDASVKFLKGVIESTTLQIALIPHVTEHGNNDSDVLKEIEQRLNDKTRVIRLPSNLTAPEYKGYIARLRFFIGARTHATIAAYSNGVPTIVLGYSVKSKGIAYDLFGEEKFVLDANTLSTAQAFEAEFKKLIEQEGEIRDTLRQMVPIKIKSAIDAGEQLKKI